MSLFDLPERAGRLTIMHEPKLDACIASTHQGQANWAGWKAPIAQCSACAYFSRTRKRQGQQAGRCSKTEALTRKKGAEFPSRAKACRFFAQRGGAHDAAP